MRITFHEHQDINFNLSTQYMNSNQNNVANIESPEQEIDHTLTARIAQGDEQAFAQLISRFSAPVYSFIYRMVGSSEESEDLMQETFYSLYKNRRTLRIDTDIHPYLFTIARRKAISFLRWRIVRNVLTPLLPSHEKSIDEKGCNPKQCAEQNQTEKLITDSLSKINPNKRAAIILRYFEGLSYSEIAKVMNKPEGTVKSLVFRGEKEMRHRLYPIMDLLRGEL